MKHYLIIGGAGFIGSNFAELLLNRGEKVTLFDNLSRKGTDFNLNRLVERFPNVQIVKGDIRYDLEKLTNLMDSVDAVYHLAGQVAVTVSVANPREDFEINALGTLNVLESIRNSRRSPPLIYASTNKVYGGMEDIRIAKTADGYMYTDLQNGIPESQSLDFHSPYGCSKGCADQYVRDYSRIYGLETVVIRQSCIYGTNQYGIEDQGWVAWFTIAAALRLPITVYGDGCQVRDILHVSDLFQAWESCLENISNTSGKIYNVGGGLSESISLLGLIKHLERLLSREVPVRFHTWRPGDQPVYISDISKINSELGWAPRIEILEGITQQLDWTLSNSGKIREVLGL